MLQWLRALAALAQDLGLVPSTHGGSQQSVTAVTRDLFWPPWALHVRASKTHPQTFNNFFEQGHSV